MKQLKLLIITLLVLAASFIFTATTPAMAHNGESHSGNDDAASTSADTSGRGETEVEIEHGAVQVKPAAGHSSQAQLKQKAQDELSARKQNRKSQSDDQRKKTCEARKQGLTNRSDRIINNSQRIQKRIDGILQKAIDYKTDKNLAPANWDSLLQAAQSAQANSSTSIITLSNVKPATDCNSTSVASDVATFKAAAAETRDNLKAYRDAVKAVLKVLADLKPSDDTTGGTN